MNEEESATTIAPGLDGASIGRPRLLVVEDDLALGPHLVRIFANCGADAVLVGTAQEARSRLADADSATALLLDEGLPDGSGIAVLEEARGSGYRGPALILTGLLDHFVANRAFELSAGYLVKPVTLEALVRFGEQVRRAEHAVAFGRPAAWAQLPVELRPLADDVLRAASLQHQAYAEYMGNLAALARAASARSRYGTHLFETCAAAVNSSRQELQRATALTRRWTPSEIELLLKRRDAHGRSITVRHLQAILAAPHSLRAALERIVRDGPDIREMEALLRRDENGSTKPKPSQDA